MDSKCLSKRSGSLFFLCWFAYMINYVCRKNYSVCMPDIISDGTLSVTSAGTLVTAFFACYGCGQLLSGYLGDKIKPRIMISIGLMGAGSCNILLPFFCFSPTAMLFIWCLNGLFCSMLWAPIVRCLSEYMTEHDRTRYAVTLASSIPVGQIAAYLIASLFLSITGWKSVFWAAGLTNIFGGILWFVGIGAKKSYIQDVMEFNRSSRMACHPISEKPDTPKKIGLLTVTLSTGILFSIVSILFNGMLKDGVTDWTPSFLSSLFPLSSSLISLATAILPVINLVGAYAAHFIYKKAGNEYSTVSIMFLIAGFGLLSLALFAHKNILLATICIAVATSSMLGANNMLLTYIPLCFAPIGKSAFLSGFLDACSYLAAALAGSVFGVLSSRFGWTITMWSWVIIAFLGAAVSALGISPWSKGRLWLKSQV